MKLFIPMIMLISIIFLKFNLSMVMLILLLFMSLTKLISPSDMLIYEFSMIVDTPSSTLINLTFISSFLIILSLKTFNNSPKMIMIILMFLTLAFSTHNMIMFYMAFEIVLIPTMILIFKNGSQPERLQASIYLLFYTILASLPLLIAITSLEWNSMLTPIFFPSMINFPLMFLLAFLVKSPMFLMHLWLPKAHVEAPMEGSMILAAILLKLGGYGLIRFIPLMMKNMKFISPWILSISLMGSTMTSMNCLRQKDLKSLIAYSSVSHMGLILASLMILTKLSMQGALIMMIAHGLSSSALFMLVNLIYTKIHTRNIISFKGLLMIIPNISFWWFLFIITNMSAPPSINLISEIMMMMALITFNMSIMIPIIVSSFMTSSFSISLFINISHNFNYNYKMMNSSETKYFLSLIIHLIPLILISLKMELLIN